MKASPQPVEVWFVEFGYDSKPRHCLVVSVSDANVRLRIEGCQPRHVIIVRALDVKNADGQKLRNDTFHYTLNQVPAR